MSTGALKRGDSLDRNQFAARFESAFRSLWCIAVAIVGDRTLAEDVLQEAALVGLEKVEQFDPSTSFRAWMGQIVRFTALNMSRRRHRSVLRGPDAEVLGLAAKSMGTSASSAVTSAGDLVPDQSSFDDRVVAALETLDSTARACLLLRTVVQMPYQEIALVLDVPAGTAMSHVHRSRHAMRTALASGEGDAGD